MRLIPVRSAGSGYALLTIVLLAVVTLPLLIPAAPETVFARRYGRKSYGARYARYIARCKGKCAGKGGAIRACIGRARKGETRNCRQVYSSDRALCTDATCAKDVKARLKLCIRTAGGRARQDLKDIARRGYGLKKCSSCCQRTKGGGSCLGYFSSSRFYGSFRYRGRLSCDGSDGGQGGDCATVCERTAARALRSCGKVRDATCAERVEAERQACLARCQPPASPGGAYLDVSGRIRRGVATWLPWFVQGWDG